MTKDHPRDFSRGTPIRIAVGRAAAADGADPVAETAELQGRDGGAARRRRSRRTPTRTCIPAPGGSRRRTGARLPTWRGGGPRRRGAACPGAPHVVGGRLTCGSVNGSTGCGQLRTRSWINKTLCRFVDIHRTQTGRLGWPGRPCHRRRSRLHACTSTTVACGQRRRCPIARLVWRQASLSRHVTRPIGRACRLDPSSAAPGRSLRGDLSTGLSTGCRYRRSSASVG